MTIAAFAMAGAVKADPIEDCFHFTDRPRLPFWEADAPGWLRARVHDPTQSAVPGFLAAAKLRVALETYGRAYETEGLNRESEAVFRELLDRFPWSPHRVDYAARVLRNLFLRGLMLRRDAVVMSSELVREVLIARSRDEAVVADEQNAEAVLGWLADYLDHEYGYSRSDDIGDAAELVLPMLIDTFPSSPTRLCRRLRFAAFHAKGGGRANAAQGLAELAQLLSEPDFAKGPLAPFAAQLADRWRERIRSDEQDRRR